MSGQKCLFVGNVAYDTEEHELRTMFSSLGTVDKFRLVRDKATGKPRGFAFVEFVEPRAAELAVRTLNGRDWHGRGLRIQYSESEKFIEAPAGQNTQSNERTSSRQNTQASRVEVRSSTSGMSPGVDMVTHILESMELDQKYEVLLQMKSYAESFPKDARELLQQNPYFALALLKMEADLGLIKDQPTEPQPQQPPPPPVEQPQPIPSAQMGNVQSMQSVAGELNSVLAALRALNLPVDQLPELLRLPDDQIRRLDSQSQRLILDIQRIVRPLLNSGNVQSLMMALGQR